MKQLLILGAIFFVGSGFYSETPSADPVSLELGIKSALKGKPKHVYVKKHDFTVHTIKVKKAGNKTTITGQISHRLKWRPDDEFYYTIEKENNVLSKEPSFKIKYNEIKRAKDWLKESSAFRAISTYLIGRPISPGEADDIEKKLENFIEGEKESWEVVAQYIVSIITVRVK
jgi:hypothetical protein